MRKRCGENNELLVGCIGRVSAGAIQWSGTVLGISNCSLIVNPDLHLQVPQPIAVQAWRAANSLACFWFWPLPSPLTSPLTVIKDEGYSYCGEVALLTTALDIPGWGVMGAFAPSGIGHCITSLVGSHIELSQYLESSTARHWGWRLSLREIRRRRGRLVWWRLARGRRSGWIAAISCRLMWTRSIPCRNSRCRASRV